jgi:tripartite ATP-independent transporter DctM subunit
MDDFTVGLIGSGILIFLVLIGVRVFYACALVGLIGVTTLVGWTGGAGNASMIPYAKGTIYALSVLPMFILIGFLAYHAGMTEKLFDAARKWVGWVPGGLAVATVFATAGFAAVSGASTATAAVFARVAIPEMLRYKYSPSLAAGVVAAGGTLASLIPPSAILVIYAIIVEESIGRLLVAGFIPGIISAIIYALLIIFMAWRNPKLGPPVRGFTWSDRMKSVPGTFPVFFVIIVIFYSMYSGWTTPTEAGAVGAFVVFIMALAGGMKWGTLKAALLETSRLTVMIFSLVWGVLIYVRFMGFAELPTVFAEWVVGLPLPAVVTMICILLFYVILGMFMDAIGMLLLTLPVVYPAVMGLGYDPIWFGIIVVKMCEVCLITPPIGLNCYVVAGVRPDIPLNEVFKGIGPFFIADLITLGVFLAWPETITWLPDLMIKKW